MTEITDEMAVWAHHAYLAETRGASQPDAQALRAALEAVAPMIRAQVAQEVLPVMRAAADALDRSAVATSVYPALLKAIRKLKETSHDNP